MFEGDWYKTGDLGYLDKKGHLYFRGRKKDMFVLASGMKVYAQDIEEALKAVPSVEDACVLGIPKEDGVQLHAVLLLKDGAPPAQDILEQANKRLAEHQCVRSATLWPFSDFPRTYSLKVKKQEVLDYLLKGALAMGLAGVPAATPNTTEAPALDRLLAKMTGISVADLRPTMALGQTLKLDSLGRVELLAAVESELGVFVDEAQVSAATTVEQLEALVASGGGTPLEEGYAKWPLNRFIVLVRTVLQSLLVFPITRLAVSLSVDGVEHVNELKGAVLFAANHQSHIDTPVVLAALPLNWRGRIAVAAAADFWFARSPARSLLATLIFNAFPFSRGDSIRPTLERCSRLLDKGWSVLIYPEGTRSTTGHMGVFKTGAGLTAVELGVSVVPVHISGTYRVLPKNQALPQRAPVRVRFGEALRFPPGTPYAEATKELQEAVEALGNQEA